MYGNNKKPLQDHKSDPTEAFLFSFIQEKRLVPYFFEFPTISLIFLQYFSPHAHHLQMHETGNG